MSRRQFRANHRSWAERGLLHGSGAHGSGCRSRSFPESPSLNVTVDWGFLTNDPYPFSNTSLPVNPPDLAALPPYHFDPTDGSTALGSVMYLTNDDADNATDRAFDVAGEITSV